MRSTCTFTVNTAFINSLNNLLPIPLHRISPLLPALLALVLILLPFGILRQHSYFTIDDSLDSDVSVYYLLNRHHVALDYSTSATVPSVMNGLPRNALRPGLNVTTGSFALFTPWAAYIIHQVLTRVAGLLGMYLLLCGPFRMSNRRGLAAALALAWATLPTYTILGVTTLGQPALLLVFMELRTGCGRWWHWLIIVLFACWSTFVFIGPFALSVLAVVLLWDWYQTARLNRLMLAGIIVYTLASVIVEWPLFYSLLTKQFVPHREEFDLGRLFTTGSVAGLRGTVQYFLFGQYHSSRFLRVSALVAVVVAIAQVSSEQRIDAIRRFAPWLIALVGLALMGGFYPTMMTWMHEHLPATSVFNFGRFYFLAALVYFLLLATAVSELTFRWQVLVVGLQIMLGLAMNGEWVNNVRTLAGRAKPHDPSYESYIAPALFRDIQQAIRKETGLIPSQYRVGCLGFAPGVAQMNDFYTLDSYQNYYPLSYKHLFRPVIAGELAKSQLLKNYYDAWGNRCYLFSAELGRNFQVGAYQHQTIQNYAFNATYFRQLGGRYVLSAARLATPARSGLKLKQVFERPGAYWQIWLYEVAN